MLYISAFMTWGDILRTHIIPPGHQGYAIRIIGKSIEMIFIYIIVMILFI